MTVRDRVVRSIDRACLLACAWRLHGAAQALAHGASLAAVRDDLRRRISLPTADPTDAAWAAAWACSLGRRLLDRLDTCLVRALVAGSLILRNATVALCVGVHRPVPDADLLDAHAWVTVDGGEVATGPGAGSSFETVLTYPLDSHS